MPTAALPMLTTIWMILEQAMQYRKQQLRIAKELRDKPGEACACLNLGTDYWSMDNIEQAIEYHILSLAMSKELGDRRLEGYAYNMLGRDYESSATFFY